MASTNVLTIPLAKHGLLGVALRLDAAITGANGLAYLALAGPLHEGLGVSESLLRGAGAFLVAFAVMVWLTAMRPATGAVRLVIVANAIWALESLALLALGVLDDPTAIGGLWVAAQALTVGGFAALQALGARRAAA